MLKGMWMLLPKRKEELQEMGRALSGRKRNLTFLHICLSKPTTSQ